MDGFHGPYFHFCLKLSLETWVQALLTHPLWVHDLGHTHSLVSVQESRPSDQGTLPRTKNCLVPTRWKECFLRLFVQESRQIAHLSLTKAFLQPAATTAMCTCCQAERCTHPLPPVPPFLLAQSLSSKRIAPTDNMQPKCDDAKRRHRLLKC